MAWVPRWEAGEERPAVILLDLKMPRVDGLSVLRALKAHPLLRCIPVVILTTSKEDKDVTTAYELGANSYIVNPVVSRFKIAKKSGESSENPAGQWNRYTITCCGNELKVVFNGEQVIDIDLSNSPMKNRPAEGHIGFQDEAKPVWYRNVKVKPLDAK